MVSDGPMGPMGGAMEHGPRYFRLLTINTTHCKNLEKIPKNYGSLRHGLRWAQMGPMTGAMEHRPRYFRLLTINTTHCKNLEKIPKNYGSLRHGLRWAHGPDGWGNGTRTPMFQTFNH